MRFLKGCIGFGGFAAAVLASAPHAAAEATGVFDVDIGKACWFAGYTNSAAVWTVTVKDGDDIVLVLEGSGVNFAPMNVAQGNARFDVKSGVSASFKATYGGSALNGRVKFMNGLIPSDSGDPALFHTTVGGEDSTDDDWQDLVLNVTCLHHAG
ncbi:MAG: hypothetical protein QNJ44_20345 [Rhodobacter sp.]|nr:hypothetical protein [Rhodobacter sp.]